MEKKSEDLGSWLSDYNKNRAGILNSLPFTSSTSSSSPSPGDNSTNDRSSSWFNWGRREENIELLENNETTTGTATTSASVPSSTSSSAAAPFSLSSPSSWLSNVPGLSSVGVSVDDSICFGLSWHQRLGLFFLSFGAGVLMLFLSFSFLSLIFLGMSAKFTLSYALANIFFLLSSSFITGPYQQLHTMCHPSRALLSSLSLLTLCTDIAAWQIRVFYIVLPLLIIQISCLIMYVLSYLPFGLPMMKRLFTVFLGTFKKMFI